MGRALGQEAPAGLTALRSAPVSAAIFEMARSHRALAARLLRQLGLDPGQEILIMQLSEMEHRTQGNW